MASFFIVKKHRRIKINDAATLITKMKKLTFINNNTSGFGNLVCQH